MVELIDHVLTNSLQAMRGGRTIKISIFDIVVGDVLPLKIGDQVNLHKSHFVSLVIELCSFYVNYSIDISGSC